MGLFDRLKNLFKTENYVYSAKELSSNTVKESKTFVPFGSLLKDTSGTFPRREKSEAASKETESKEKTKASLFTRIFSRFRNKPLSEETKNQIQQLMEKSPAAAKVFFGIFDVKELKSIESYLDKNSELGGQWLEFRDAATEVLKSKETDKKMQDDLGRIARAYGVEPRDLELKQVVEGEKRKREKGEFGKENLDEKAMESSAKMFEKAEEAAKREMVLRQYPQTADFFRVVEGEDENKLFSPNKSLLPQISEAEIKKVSDIGMRETTTSGILSKVMHALRGIRSRDEEIGVKKQESLQQLAGKLTLQLVDFWGIPNVKPFSVKVQILGKENDEKLRKAIPMAGTIDANGVHIILVNEDYLNEEFRSGLINIKSVLAEEVCHYLEDDVKSMYGKFTEDRYVSEFFGIISRFCISEQNPEMFREDYRKYLHQAASFSIEKKQYEDALKKLAEDKRKIQSDMTEGRPTNPEELKRIEDEEKEIKDDLDHLSYYPGAAYYYEVKAMNRQQRFELLMESPQQIRNSIIEGKKLIEKLNSIGPKAYDRESRKFTDAVMTKFGLEQSPGTASFFQKVAEGAGKEEYGRGAKSLQEVSMELSDVKSAEEIPLQNFVRNISIDLAGWWDIPIEKIEGKIPKVQIISDEELGSLAAYSWNLNTIYVSDKLLGGHVSESPEKAGKYRFSIDDVKGVLAEEVGHFVTDFAYYELVPMKMDPFVAEFFGLTSSLHIAEQIPQMFKEDYRSFLKEATDFSKKERLLNELINLKIEKLTASRQKLFDLERSGKYLGDPDFKAAIDELINTRKEIENFQLELNHLSYYPAVAFYYEARKMSPTDRYRLITLPEEVFRRDLIKPVQKNLDSLKQILAERFEKKYPTLLYGVYSKALPQIPEGLPEPEGMKAVKAEFIGEANKGLEGSSGFFQRVATETGKIGYGRVTVKEEVEEQSALGAGAIAGTLKGLENVGGFFQRAASEIGKAAYGRMAESVAAKLEQQEPAIETDEEYPQEEQPLEEEYQETGEAQVENEQFEQEPSESEEYQEAEQNLEEQTQGEYEQSEEAQEEQYGPESEQAPPPPQINISIPDKVTKKVAKKLESMGVKLPKNMIKK